MVKICSVYALVFLGLSALALKFQIVFIVLSVGLLFTFFGIHRKLDPWIMLMYIILLLFAACQTTYLELKNGTDALLLMSMWVLGFLFSAVILRMVDALSALKPMRK